MRYPLQSPVVAGRKRFTSEELANLDVSCQVILTWRGITPITDAQHEQVCSLMAAAPALLRALEGILMIRPDYHAGRDDLWLNRGEVERIARDAIALVNGGAK